MKLFCLSQLYVLAVLLNFLDAFPVDEFLKTGEDVNVTTAHGTFVGRRRDGLLKEDNLMEKIDWYLGVPYVSRPKRFEKPVPLPYSNNTYLAISRGHECPSFRTIKNEEDCLFANIYSPVTKESKLLPVMVYIHGGSYAVGEGFSYSGDKLAQHGVVVVTFNYRLAFGGFMTAKHPSMKGNYGLHDQIEALKWVQNNIHLFRGDPQRVTIFGNSAGGSSVGLLCLIPQAKGLFSQAVVQSGSPFSFWATSHLAEFNYETFVREVASYLNCDQLDMYELVNCLKQVDMEKLTNTVDDMLPLAPTNTDFAPVIDDELLTAQPENYTHFTFNGPLMAGVVSNEFAIHYSSWIYFYSLLLDYEIRKFRRTEDRPLLKDGETYASKLREATRYILKNYFTGYTDEDVDKIYDYYLWKKLRHKTEDHSLSSTLNTENVPITGKDTEELKYHNDLLADMFLVLPTFKFAIKHQNLSRQPTYFYEFNYETNLKSPGNCHEIELSYIFGHLIDEMDYYDYVEFTDEKDLATSRFMMKLWVNFAKFGNPNGVNTSRIKHEWKQLTDKLDYYNIINEDQSRPMSEFRAKQLQFWSNMKSLRPRLKNDSNSVFYSKLFIVIIVIYFAFIVGVEY